MTLHPVGAFLTRFEEQLAPFTIDHAPLEPLDEALLEHVVDSAPPPELLTLDAALAEARALAEAECEQKLTLEKQRFADRLQSERQRWIEEEGQQLATTFAMNVEKAVAQMHNSLARVLTPFIAREIADRLLQDFVDTLRIALAKGETSAIELSGPKDLLDIVEAHLARESIAVRRTDNLNREITANVGFASIETNIESWLQKISSGVS